MYIHVCRCLHLIFLRTILLTETDLLGYSKSVSSFEKNYTDHRDQEVERKKKPISLYSFPTDLRFLTELHCN